MYRFHTLSEADFPLLLKWLSRPHVKEWWNDGDDTLAKVTAHYSADPDETKRFLLSYQSNDPNVQETTIGYFQYYLQPQGVVGIDQFIAKAQLLNRGIGASAIAQFIELINEREDPHCVIVDPDLRNLRAIRCYEKVGFRYTHTVKDAEGALAYMMRLDV